MHRGRLVQLRGWTVAIAGLLAAGAGCAESPYLSGYGYYPQPAVVQVIQRGNEQAPPVTVLASIIGVRRGDADKHTPPAVDVRLRFEDNGPASMSFDPSTLDLVTGTLFTFPRPAVSPPTPISLAAGQRAEVNASFPFPPNLTPGQIDLNNLRMRWVVRVANYPVPQTALFQRVGPGYAPEEPYSSDVAY